MKIVNYRTKKVRKISFAKFAKEQKITWTDKNWPTTENVKKIKDNVPLMKDMWSFAGGVVKISNSEKFKNFSKNLYLMNYENFGGYATHTAKAIKAERGNFIIHYAGPYTCGLLLENENFRQHVLRKYKVELKYLPEVEISSLDYKYSMHIFNPTVHFGLRVHGEKYRNFGPYLPHLISRNKLTEELFFDRAWLQKNIVTANLQGSLIRYNNHVTMGFYPIEDIPDNGILGFDYGEGHLIRDIEDGVCFFDVELFYLKQGGCVFGYLFRKQSQQQALRIVRQRIEQFFKADFDIEFQSAALAFELMGFHQGMLEELTERERGVLLEYESTIRSAFSGSLFKSILRQKKAHQFIADLYKESSYHPSVMKLVEKKKLKSFFNGIAKKKIVSSRSKPARITLTQQPRFLRNQKNTSVQKSAIEELSKFKVIFTKEAKRDPQLASRFFAACGYTHCMRKLLKEHKVDINRGSKKSGQTPLMIAARKGHGDMVEYLLTDAGASADPSLRDKSEKNAIDYAATEKIRKLILSKLDNSAELDEDTPDIM